MSSYKDCHLCGNEKGQEWCDGFYENGTHHDLIRNDRGRLRTLMPYTFYCKKAGYRKIASKSSWTGVSPTWCPKRKAQEAGHEQE